MEKLSRKLILIQTVLLLESVMSNFFCSKKANNKFKNLINLIFIQTVPLLARVMGSAKADTTMAVVKKKASSLPAEVEDPSLILRLMRRGNGARK